MFTFDDGFVTGSKDSLCKVWTNELTELSKINLATSKDGYKGSCFIQLNYSVNDYTISIFFLFLLDFNIIICDFYNTIIVLLIYLS